MSICLLKKADDSLRKPCREQHWDCAVKATFGRLGWKRILEILKIEAVWKILFCIVFNTWPLCAVQDTDFGSSYSLALFIRNWDAFFVIVFVFTFDVASLFGEGFPLPFALRPVIVVALLCSKRIFKL